MNKIQIKLQEWNDLFNVLSKTADNERAHGLDRSYATYQRARINSAFHIVHTLLYPTHYTPRRSANILLIALDAYIYSDPKYCGYYWQKRYYEKKGKNKVKKRKKK
jgi:hypothetical protein